MTKEIKIEANCPKFKSLSNPVFILTEIYEALGVDVYSEEFNNKEEIRRGNYEAKVSGQLQCALQYFQGKAFQEDIVEDLEDRFEEADVVKSMLLVIKDILEGKAVFDW